MGLTTPHSIMLLYGSECCCAKAAAAAVGKPMFMVMLYMLKLAKATGSTLFEAAAFDTAALVIVLMFIMLGGMPMFIAMKKFMGFMEAIDAIMLRNAKGFIGAILPLAFIPFIAPGIMPLMYAIIMFCRCMPFIALMLCVAFIPLGNVFILATPACGMEAIAFAGTHGKEDVEFTLGTGGGIAESEDVGLMTETLLGGEGPRDEVGAELVLLCESNEFMTTCIRGCCGGEEKSGEKWGRGV